MLPFPIMNNYGNIVIKKDIIDIQCTPTGSTVLLYNNGDLYGFGQNLYGELGQGNTNIVQNITLIDTGVRSVHCGLADIMYIKGNNFYVAGYGHILDTSPISRTVFTDCTSYFSGIDISAIKKIELDICAFILMNNGTLYASGLNAYGSYGNGTQTRSGTPIIVQTGVQDIKVNYQYGTFILKNNQLYSAGYNGNYQLGSTSTIQRVLSFTLVTKFSTVTSLDNLGLSGFASFYNDSGTVYGSGSQSRGIFGNGITSGNISSFSATIPVPSNFTGKMFRTGAANVYYISPIICCTDGFYYAGDNTGGRMGGTGPSAQFVRMSTMDNYVQDYENIHLLCNSQYHTCFVYNNNLYAAGNADMGCLPGYNGVQSSFVPIQIPT